MTAPNFLDGLFSGAGSTLRIPTVAQVRNIARVDATGINIEYVSTLTARQQLVGAVFFPEDYGALGDNIANDLPAIQAAINAAGVAGGGIVRLAAKTYRVVGSITINNAHKGVHLEGAIPVTTFEADTAQTYIKYDSAVTAAGILYLRRRGTFVSNIIFQASPGRTVRSGLEIDHDPAGGAIMTEANIEYCFFQGANGGAGIMQYGVQIGIRDITQGNLEHNQLTQCKFEYQSIAGFRQSATDGQSKANILYHCSFAWITGPAISLNRGSVGVYSPAYGQCAVGIYVENISDTIYEIGADCELCTRYFETAFGSVGEGWQCTTLIGARVNPSGVHADGKMIKMGFAGPLNVIGTDFTDGIYTAAWRVDCSNPNSPNMASFSGCIFPNETPFAPSFTNYKYRTDNCFAMPVTGTQKIYPDGVFRSHEEPLPAQTLTGLVAWLDAQNVTQVFDLATATKRISAATDLSQQGRNAAQATAANQPLLIKNWRAGMPAFHFDSTARFLDIADHLDLNVGLGSWLILMVAEWSGASAFHTLIGKGSSASANNIRCMRQSADTLGVYWGADASAYGGSSLTWPVATPAVIGFGVNSSTNHVMYVKNQTVNRNAVTVSGTGSNALAMRINGDNASNYLGVFKLGEVAVYKRAVGVDITDAQIQALTLQLQRKWNL